MKHQHKESPTSVPRTKTGTGDTDFNFPEHTPSFQTDLDSSLTDLPE
ncbi:hypothetical protein Mal48_20290 [Thalassoglobus polymorphus]|uniref:Uncharacterized protein n=1 Tax=Thalassoglobus polymorphus TaxID=2527994 RepID=A0A517QMB3_9PLAN|nr:hypothetical protein Mal48_20290 [Thalassoglobus polymorphus]